MTYTPSKKVKSPTQKMAGTYVKLADAYAAEKEKIGSFEAIGYVPPGQVSGSTWATNTFTYSQNLSGTSPDYSQEVWSASANGKMNDCAASSVWTVTTTLTASTNTATSGTLTHVAATPTGATATACASLTPSFTAIGNSSGS